MDETVDPHWANRVLPKGLAVQGNLDPLALIAGGDAAGRRALEANLPTSGVAVIDFKIDDWDDIGFRGGQLERFASPKWLREESGEA